jgi:hypothetical protein
MRADSKVPQNLQAERAVLGAAILDRQDLIIVTSALEERDFLLSQNQCIFRHLCKMHAEGSPVDLLTLVDRVDNLHELDRAGGAGYISSLIDGLHKRSNVPSYATIVREKAVLRRIAQEADKVAASALKGDLLPADLLAQTNVTFSKLANEIQQNRSRISRLDQVPTLDQLPEAQIAWTVPGLIPEAGVSLLAGAPSVFKTWIALAIARGISTGGSVLGRQVNQREILFLDRENPLSVVRQRAKILRMMSTPFFRYWGGWQHDSPPLIGDRRLLEIARDRKPVIFFDSFIRFHEGDENLAKEMAPIMAHLRDLANAGAAVIVLHHRAKAESSKFRGSSDILAAVDFAYSLSREDDNGHLRMRCFKNRVGEEFELLLQPDLAKSGDILVVDDRKALGEDFKKLSNIITNEPGMIQSELIKKSGVGQKRCAYILKKGEDTNWRTERGERNALKYFPIGDLLIEDI